MSELRSEVDSKHVWKYGMGEKVSRTSSNPSSGLDRSLWNGYVAMTCGSCGPPSYSSCSKCIWGKPFLLTCLFHGAIVNSRVLHYYRLELPANDSNIRSFGWLSYRTNERMNGWEAGAIRMDAASGFGRIRVSGSGRESEIAAIVSTCTYSGNRIFPF